MFVMASLEVYTEIIQIAIGETPPDYSVPV